MSNSLLPFHLKQTYCPVSSENIYFHFRFANHAPVASDSYWCENSYVKWQQLQFRGRAVRPRRYGRIREQYRNKTKQAGLSRATLEISYGIYSRICFNIYSGIYTEIFCWDLPWNLLYGIFYGLRTKIWGNNFFHGERWRGQGELTLYSILI